MEARETWPLTDAFTERHANSKYWVDFEDFSFYRMHVVDVYYVGGFGVMGWVSVADYDGSQPDPLADSMAEIIQHMNADHKDGSSCLPGHLLTSTQRKRR
jgi:heme iron utilization protein